MTGVSNPMENSIFANAKPVAEQSDNAQPKSSRPTAKQRKSDLEDYRKAYFGLIKLGKDNKHQVAINHCPLCNEEWRNHRQRRYPEN